MSNPIAIIHWESNAALGSGGPRVAHVFSAEDLTNLNFIGITSAIIFMLPGTVVIEGNSKLLQEVDLMARISGCRITLQPFGLVAPLVFPI